MLVNKRWKRKIIKTARASERMITTMIKHRRRTIVLASASFSPHGVHKRSHREDVQMHRESLQQKTYHDHSGWFQRTTRTWWWIRKWLRWKTCTGRIQQALYLDETVVDEPKLYGAQHNIQEKIRQASYLQDLRVGKTRSWIVCWLTKEADDIVPMQRQTTCYTWGVTTDLSLPTFDSHAVEKERSVDERRTGWKSSQEYTVHEKDAVTTKTSEDHESTERTHENERNERRYDELGKGSLTSMQQQHRYRRKKPQKVEAIETSQASAAATT